MKEAYQEQARVLWPPQPGARTGRYRLAAVPDPRRPRLLVPADRPRAAAGALLRFSSALGAREVAARTGFATLLRAGLGRALPGVVVDEGPESVRAHLAGVLGEPVEVSLGLGTARANRKPVLEVFDVRGRRLAFAKVGTTAATRAHVDAEAAALRRLGGTDLPHDLLVPRVIAHDAWRDCSVLVMTGLPSSPARARDAQLVPAREADALARALGEPAAPLPATGWWAGLAGVAADHPRLAGALEALAALDAHLGTACDLGAWHGDWTPWNQSRTRRGLALWDWERFETGVPVGLDRCHFAVNAQLRRHQHRPEVVLDALRRAGLDPSDPQDRRLASAYLLTVAARYLRDGAGATGEAAGVVQRRAALVLDAHDGLGALVPGTTSAGTTSTGTTAGHHR